MSDEFPTDDTTRRRQSFAPPTVSPATVSPATVSPDGRFWWDGADWKPLPDAAGASPAAASPAVQHMVGSSTAIASEIKRSRHKSAGNWGALVAIAVLAFLVVGAVHASREAEAASKAASEPFGFCTPEDLD